MTSYDKLKSLPDAKKYLKSNITLEKLDALATELIDLEAGRKMNEARSKLFKSIFKESQKLKI